MLAKLARAVPEGEDLWFEPKWDGFRCLAFRDGGDVHLQSRNGRPLARYFPEIVAGLRRLSADRVVLDGELLVTSGGAFDFSALLARTHPAASRVERLAQETPATYVAFDVLALRDHDLRDQPVRERRRILEEVLTDAEPPICLTPGTYDRTPVDEWLMGATGIDGVVVKEGDLTYQPGKRAMVKVKPEHTVDCVIGGFRMFGGPPRVASLLLGLHDGAGELHLVGVAASFTKKRAVEILEHLLPYVAPVGIRGSRGSRSRGVPSGAFRGRSAGGHPTWSRTGCRFARRRRRGRLRPARGLALPPPRPVPALAA
jgi:ATP-dependent DNA ligase